MNLKLIACFLCFTSCAEFIQIGTTNCGAKIYASKTLGDGGFPEPTIDGGIAWTMDSINKAEELALKLLNDTKDERLHNGCRNINGLVIRVSEKPLWTDSSGRTVGGQAFCAQPMYGLLNEITIGTNRPSRSSLAHEYAHILQACKPIGPADLLGGDDQMHAGWQRDRIWEAQGWFMSQLEAMGL